MLKEQVDEIVQSDSKVIIFSQYIDEGIKKIKECLQGYKTAEILGQQSPSLRRKQIEIFKNSNDVRILLASIKSGGEGLNLTEASYVIHFDHWWNPAVMWQAEDRVHRRGQTRGVNVYSYWVKETIDERIHAILKHKGWLFEEVIDDLSEEKIEDKMTLDDYLRILGINREQILDRKQTEPHINSQAITIEQIREKLLDLTPERFEELTRDLLIHLGFPNVMLTGKSGDGGIDLVAVQNTQTGIEKVVVQCKRYRGNLGVQIARNFLGAMSADASIKQGLLITTGQFTRNCLHFCSVNNIRTVDGFEVAKYVKQFGLDSHLV